MFFHWIYLFKLMVKYPVHPSYNFYDLMSRVEWYETVSDGYLSWGIDGLIQVVECDGCQPDVYRDH